MLIFIGRLENTIKGKSCITLIDEWGIEYIAECAYSILEKNGIKDEGDRFTFTLYNPDNFKIEKKNKIRLSKEEVMRIKKNINDKLKEVGNES